MKLAVAIIATGLIVIVAAFLVERGLWREVKAQPSWAEATPAEAYAERQHQEQMQRQRVEDSINRISAQRQSEIAAEQAGAELLEKKAELWRGVAPTRQ